MNVFVTGGSGFVGGRLIEVLVERGDAVRALARSDTAASKVEARGAEAIRGDLSDLKAMTEAMSGCELVVHSAAYVEEPGDAKTARQVNVEGTKTVLEAAKLAGVPTLVHVSTEAVLVGGPPIVDADETWPYPDKPLGVYPPTKGEAERLVRAASTETFRTSVVRPRFIWGRGDTSVLPQLVDAVNSGDFVWIGGGEHLSHTCHVDNVCEGILCAAERGGPGEVYFLTDGEPVVFKDFITKMLATRGVTPKDKSMPRWLVGMAAGVLDGLRAVGMKPGMPLSRANVRLIGETCTVSDAKARDALGYEGRVTIEAGLAGMSGER